ncbi:MAG: hypothetical protein CMG63_02260 [Candidatus Marinimicrobia bacterium]|nr:hypothetical protein [Candidatus Neomarinimicrobiota bacterium]
MKNLYKNKKLICTIISDTPYAKNKNGDLVGLGPTVEEIDQLSSLFCQIYHFAPLEKRKPPLSFNKHNKNNITLIPMIPSGGKYIFSKLKHVFLFPLHLLRLNPILKKTEIIHFRAPSGFGVLFLPWLYVFWKKKIWIKYAGSWSSNTAPITYKFQRWLLLRFPKNAIITINNTTKHLANNFYQFRNPCFEEILIKTNKPLVQKKKFTDNLNLIFVGRVEENKGVDELFKVFHKIGNMENINSLKVIGESKKKRFYEEKARMSSPKILMLGALNREEIFQIYKESHAIILLSKSEGFPKVIMEAGVFGCVPIVSKFSGASEIIKHGTDGFIMDSFHGAYNFSDFQSLFEDLEALKVCSMNIFEKTHSFTYEKYLKKIENAILY